MENRAPAHSALSLFLRNRALSYSALSLIVRIMQSLRRASPLPILNSFDSMAALGKSGGKVCVSCFCTLPIAHTSRFAMRMEEAGCAERVVRGYAPTQVHGTGGHNTRPSKRHSSSDASRPALRRKTRHTVGLLLCSFFLFICLLLVPAQAPVLPYALSPIQNIWARLPAATRRDCCVPLGCVRLGWALALRASGAEMETQGPRAQHGRGGRIAI